MISLNLKYLLKTLSLNIVKFEVRGSTYELYGNTIKLTAPGNSPSTRKVPPSLLLILNGQD